MKSKWHVLHPATLFLLLTAGIVFLSWIFDIYSLRVKYPVSGELIDVQSLLSPEGMRWWLRHIISNFTGFAPLGMVMVTMLGIGIAEYSGFINACIRKGLKDKMSPAFVIWLVIFLGIVSNVLGDVGYIVLIPIAAILFRSVKLHPVAGIITAFVSVACGFSANLFLTTLDPLLARYTSEAAAATGIYEKSIGALSNYWFMFFSTFIIATIIYWVTRKYLLVSIKSWKESDEFIYKPLSRREGRALGLSLWIGVIYILIILAATFSSWGIFRGITGGMAYSPFMMGALFLFSLGAGLMGIIYGFACGRYRTDEDVIKSMSESMSILSGYFVITFFAAQMFACLEYSHLDKCLAIWGAGILASFQGGSLITIILFILFTAFINLFMVSSTAKWAFMAFIFVPWFAAMGISPDWTQCAYRIGDSMTNAVTPFLFYMPLILAYLQQYDKHAHYGALLRYTWRYTFFISLGWILLFMLWYMFKFPLGF